jgi:glycosyltransferase involved in cell wall biosynthesis
MRILLSGALNPAFEAIPEALAAACRGMGHEVAVFDHRRFLIPGRIRACVGRLDRLDRAALNGRFLRLIRRFRPEVVIVNQGMVLEAATVEAARRLGARCLNWFSDYPAEFEAGLERAIAYDAFYLAASHAARRHQAAGRRRSFWLPFGCDPEGAAGSWPVAAPPVVFVGSWYPERQILLRHLRGLPAGVWGPGWERAAGDPGLRGLLRGGALRRGAWRALYAAARVAVNIHYGCFGPPEVSGGLANTRVFEIAAAGTCQVVDRQGDVLRLFREGDHLLCFSTGEELRARVEEALREPARARAIAGRARAAVAAAHTWTDRVRHLLDPRARDFAPATALPAAAGGSA